MRHVARFRDCLLLYSPSAGIQARGRMVIAHLLFWNRGTSWTMVRCSVCAAGASCFPTVKAETAQADWKSLKAIWPTGRYWVHEPISNPRYLSKYFHLLCLSRAKTPAWRSRPVIPLRAPAGKYGFVTPLTTLISPCLTSPDCRPGRQSGNCRTPFRQFREEVRLTSARAQACL